MNRVGRITAAVLVVLGLAACQSGYVAHATVLDVRLGVEVTHLRLARPKRQPQRTNIP